MDPLLFTEDLSFVRDNTLRQSIKENREMLSSLKSSEADKNLLPQIEKRLTALVKEARRRGIALYRSSYADERKFASRHAG